MIIDNKLRIFRMAAQLRHFSDAAKALGMSQSNVTQQIATLEKDLQTALFLRDGRAVSLTVAGEALLNECNVLFGDAEAALRRVRNAAGTEASYMIGGTMTAGAFILPGLVSAYMDEKHRTNIGITVDNTAGIVERLKRRSLELALIEGPFDRELFNGVKLCDDELIPVGAAGELPEKFCLAGYIASGGAFVLREEGSGTRYYFDAFMKRHGLKPQPERIMTANNFEAIKRLVLLRRGVTVISRFAVADELASGVLSASSFCEGEIKRELNFITIDPENRRFTENFITFCRIRLREKSGSSAAR